MGGIALGGGRRPLSAEAKQASLAKKKAKYEAEKAVRHAKFAALIPQIDAREPVGKALAKLLKPKRVRKTKEKKYATKAERDEHMASLKTQWLLNALQGHANEKTKQLYLKNRIFGTEKTKHGYPPSSAHKMTHADKVELSNWLATHWDNENPPRGYGSGIGSTIGSIADSIFGWGEGEGECAGGESQNYQLMAGGRMRKAGRPRKVKGEGVGSTIGSIADSIFGWGEGEESQNYELMAGGRVMHKRRPRKASTRSHNPSDRTLAQHLKHEIHSQHLDSAHNVLGHGGAGARRVGRPRKHTTRGGVPLGGDWKSVLGTLAPLALAFL